MITCNICQEEIDKCEQCKQEFNKGDKIFCEGNYHFCSENCVMEYEGVDEGVAE